ncbi:unnamed protein product (macronuclear) [Paramecium tetraurelia]|uniref:Uncharacterized protein n=1 Tax=Paramecium tetraurelia TaxID=5888 RepID=A0EDF2_PARTE|nr:uncharacterized protein GSPATT00004188001 [Paramecium tetraurelia]CAK93319.1 unnamed protein product [Paramecium tetraurelia]|eukprot:XP_001460716.1 hypothetical protein (macronuclear) [Paramecium tetraurelia strain d4-2]
MNFYALDFEDQNDQALEDHEQIQVAEEQEYEFEQSSNIEIDKNNTFDGYLPEEQVLLFNVEDESPKKKLKSIVRKSKKIKKSDTETDVQSQKKMPKFKMSNDIAKLQQCQMLKTIISQMETILQNTRTQILSQIMKKQQIQ